MLEVQTISFAAILFLLFSGFLALRTILNADLYGLPINSIRTLGYHFQSLSHCYLLLTIVSFDFYCKYGIMTKQMSPCIGLSSHSSSLQLCILQIQGCAIPFRKTNRCKLKALIFYTWCRAYLIYNNYTSPDGSIHPSSINAMSLGGGGGFAEDSAQINRFPEMHPIYLSPNRGFVIFFLLLLLCMPAPSHIDTGYGWFG